MGKAMMQRAKNAKRVEQPATGARPDEGYVAWLAAEIEAGCAELDSGKGIPAERVWKELDLE